MMNRYRVAMEHQTFADAPEYWAKGYSDAINKWWDAEGWDEAGRQAIETSDEVMVLVYIATYTANPPAGDPTAHVGKTWVCLVDIADGNPKLVDVT
jgi:hypothetical protein